MNFLFIFKYTFMNKWKSYKGNPRVRNAVKTVIDGITYDSRLEAHMHGRLKQFGVPVEYQHKIVLVPGYRATSGVWSRPMTWSADFYFPWCGELMDTKGYFTDVAKLKVKLVRYMMHKGEVPYKSLVIVKLGADVDKYVLRMLNRYKQST